MKGEWKNRLCKNKHRSGNAYEQTGGKWRFCIYAGQPGRIQYACVFMGDTSEVGGRTGPSSTVPLCPATMKAKRKRPIKQKELIARGPFSNPRKRHPSHHNPH